MMKAMRNYKEVVAKKESKQVKENTKKMDQMKKSEDVEHEKQLAEFETFLRNAVAKSKPFPFLSDMHDKLVIHGHLLSDNMMNALRKCMEREKQWAKEKEEKKTEAPKTITLKIKPFLMKQIGLDSRIITGVVKAESAKAWLIEGHADMLDNMSFCVRCAKELTEPASQVTGMGKVCAEKAGIPYDSAGVLNASKKERAKIRKEFQKTLRNQKFERWIPKSQAEIFEN